MKYVIVTMLALLLMLGAGCVEDQDRGETQADAAPVSAVAGQGEPAGQGEASPAAEHAGFTLGRIHLGMTLGEVRDYIELRGLRVIRDTVGEGETASGDILTHEHETFVLREGRLHAYAPAAIYDTSKAEFRVLAAQLDADNPDAERGSGKGDVPEGYPVMEGDVEDAARLEWWLDEAAQQLLVAGWREKDGYYWLWLTGPG